MRVLSFGNHKGGAGKTTSVIHFAAALGLSGHRVLIIDLDPQGFLSRALNVREQPPEATSMMLFQEGVRLRDIQPVNRKGFGLIPASPTMTKLIRRLNKPTDIFWIKKGLQEVEAFDYILLDTAAAVTSFTLNAFVASNHVIIPVTPEYQPIVGAEQTFQTINIIRQQLNPGLEEPRFLFTNVDERKRNHAHFRRYLRKRYPERVMRTEIRTNAALAARFVEGSSVFDQAPYSRGARDYANATDELLHHFNVLVEN